MFERNFDAANAHEQSKLANILFTKELARRLEGSGVTANALSAGVTTRNELYARFWLITGFTRMVFALIEPFLVKNTRESAQTSVYCALADELEEVSGRYFSECREKELLPHALNDEDAAQLWAISEELSSFNPKNK